MKEKPGSMLLCISGIVQDKGEGIDGPIRDFDCTQKIGIEFRFQGQSLIAGEKRRRDFHLFAGFEETVPEIQAILGEGDKEPIRGFNTVRRNLSMDPIFDDTFPGCFWVGNSIPATAMK
jgi:hypothetical protein